jgi:hypothetical protein
VGYDEAVVLARRGFLALVAGTAAGLFIAPAQLLAAPRSVILRLAGACSFCGKAAEQVIGFAGMRGKGTRICNECVSLCLDILQQQGCTDLPPPPPPYAPPPSAYVPSTYDPSVLDRLIDELRRNPLPPRRPSEIFCSFCDTHQSEVAKIIAGPSVYICDACIAGAATLFGNAHTHAHQR